MAKKNYQKVTLEYAPRVIDNGTDKAFMELRCTNSKGTDVDITMRIDLYFFPQLIREFKRIADQRVKNAIEFQQRIKEAAE